VARTGAVLTPAHVGFVGASTSNMNVISPEEQRQNFRPYPLFMSPSRAKQKAKLQKLKHKHSFRTPSHHLPGEAAGITSGIGLWKEFRRRMKNRKRLSRAMKETLDSTKPYQFLLTGEGRRRKKIKERLKKLGYKFSSSSRGDKMELEVSSKIEEDDDDYNEFSLVAMRARAGVLRTRIRLKQDELKELEILMRDVVREMRMEGFLTTEDKLQDVQTDVDRGNFASDIEVTNTYYNGESETGGLMNEYELSRLNNQWKNQSQSITITPENDEEDDETDNEDLMYEFQLDLMKIRSAEIQSTILLDRIKLQRLERRILCCESSELGLLERAVGNTLGSLNEADFLETNPLTLVRRQARKFANTFGESSSVLFRRIDRVSSSPNASSRNYESLTDFVVKETSAGIRIVGNLLSNPSQLTQLIDPETPTLIPHVPAILSRLDRLESHVAPILSRVLNNKQHLKTIEPYLPEILERFDDVEPHLPYILDNIDVLAPYTGLLLKHIDELLLYAAVDEYEANGDKNNYAFAEQLLPYLEVYVSQLDLVGPHLPLLRPHLPLLLKHNRIKILSPHVGKLFAKGYQDLSGKNYTTMIISFSFHFYNLFILIFFLSSLCQYGHTAILFRMGTVSALYVASLLCCIFLTLILFMCRRIPFVPWMFFSFPGSPGMVSFLANRLPKRLVRGRCSDVSCYVDGDYGGDWNKLSK
jgi:hypothetical protein